MERARRGIVLSVVGALLLALAGFGLLAPVGVRAATLSTSDCASITATSIQSVFTTGGTVAYTGTTPCPVTLTAPLTINGDTQVAIDGGVGLTISGGASQAPGTFDLIDMTNAASTTSLTLGDVTLEYGKNGVFDPAQQATVTLTNSTITGISANGSEASNAGISVGIDAGTVSLTNSTISDITANGGTGSGNGGNGGISIGIESQATTTLTNSTISDITANGGTGSGNGGAGGISIGIESQGTVSLTNSTISGIMANGGSGGGLSGGNGGISTGIQSQGATTLANTTISGITAAGGTGGSLSGGNGGISTGIQSRGATTLTNSTISDITANGGTGGSAGNGGLITGIDAGAATLTASILADSGTNCKIPSLDDGGFNRSASPAGSDTSCPFTGTSKTVTDAALNLLPLGNYGGPTQTIALGPGSDAIDQIPVGTTATIGGQTVVICPSATDPTFADQRGIPRPQGDKCDIGAYEAPALSLTVDPADPNGTNGWYTTDPTLTLDYSGLAIGQDSTGAPLAQVASCSGLSHTATTLDDSGSVSFTLRAEGTTAIGNCGVKQGTTALGFSTSGKTLFLLLNVDTTKPTVSASAKLADGGDYTFGDWTNQPVTVTLAADDVVSGVKSISYTIGSNPTQTITGDSGSFTISGQGQYTISYFATDNAGNVSTTHSVEVDIDLHAPSITITSPKAQAYVLKSTPAAGYSCAVSPGISPVTACSGTVTLLDTSSQTVADGSTLPTNELGSYTFVVNAENAAGNTSSRTVVYTVGYAMKALPGNTTTVNPGYYALIRFAPEDANGHDYASRTLKVTSVELDAPDGQTIAFAYPFQYGTFSGEPGYQLATNTRNLSIGTWTLVVQIGTGAQATTGTVTFTVE